MHQPINDQLIIFQVAIYLPQESNYAKKKIVSEASLEITDTKSELSIYLDNDMLSLPQSLSLLNDWDKFNLGSRFIVCESEYLGKRVSIDLSQSKRIKLSGSSSRESSINYIIKIRYDSIKLVEDNINNIKENNVFLHLNPNGFHIVKRFYNLISISNENRILPFKIKDYKFKIKEGFFKPQFHLRIIDGTNLKNTTIIKQPYIGLFLNSDIKYINLTIYESVILSVCSFYHQVSYVFVLKEYVFTDHIERVYSPQKQELEVEPLDHYLLGIHLNFPQFITKIDIDFIWENYMVIKKVVELYVQARFLSETTEFLVRYNILEVLASYIYKSFSTASVEKNISKFKGSDDEIEQLFNDSLNTFLNSLIESNHAQFTKSWQYFKSEILNKGNLSLTEKLELLFEQAGIDISKFPISLKKIVKLRNNITHGSLGNTSSDDVQKYNKLLFQLNGLTILRFMGIKSKLYSK